MAYTDQGSSFGYGAVLTSLQMQNLRDNLDAAFAGEAGAPEVDNVALHTATTVITVATGAAANNYTVTGGEYMFYPQIKQDAGVSGAHVAQLFTGQYSDLSTSYVTYIHIDCSGGAGAGNTYFQFRYITASGPLYWIFILRDKKTKKIEAISAAPDHICYGNGGNPKKLPYPFVKVDFKKHEIIVINPTFDQVTMMEAIRWEDELEPKGILETWWKLFEVDEESNPEWPETPCSVGVSGRTKKTIYKPIPRPDNILYKSLKKKNDK